VKERPILICYDGSEDARRAVAAAADLLAHRETVILDVTPPLTVEEEEAALTPVIPDNVESRVRDVQSIAHRGTLQARAKGLEAVDRVVVAAPAWQGVVEVADEIDAGVIVVGSRGLSGARELFEGSLSHELTRHAGRPLLIVPPLHRTIEPA